MNNTNLERVRGDNDPDRTLDSLTQANQVLSKQVDDCARRLKYVQTTLIEAERVVAQHHQLEVDQNKLLIRERELNELKSNFVTLASHEFRTPMMTILSSASLIGHYTREADGDKRERHVQRIKSAVNSLTGMLNDFLSISQMEQDTVSNQALDIENLCQEVITAMTATAKAHQRFQYEHLRGASILVQDGSLVKYILLNLLSNASKYSAEDSAIQLTSAVGDNQLTLVVTDQGIGIPDTDKDKLFINFFRARNAIHFQGTGLGLYLVKRYVDLLGGTITFTSQLGEGTRFIVQIPLVVKPT